MGNGAQLRARVPFLGRAREASRTAARERRPCSRRAAALWLGWSAKLFANTPLFFALLYVAPGRKRIAWALRAACDHAIGARRRRELGRALDYLCSRGPQDPRARGLSVHGARAPTLTHVCVAAQVSPLLLPALVFMAVVVSLAFAYNHYMEKSYPAAYKLAPRSPRSGSNSDRKSSL